MNLMVKLIVTIFWLVTPLLAMEFSESNKINNAVLAKIHADFLDIFNARQSFIRSVESQLSLIDDKDLYLAFARDIVLFNRSEDKDYFNTDDFLLFKENFAQQFKILLSDQEQLSIQISEQFLRRDRIMTELGNKWLNEPNRAEFKELEERVLAATYIFLLHGLENAVEFNRQSKRRQLRLQVQERKKACRENRPLYRNVLYCLDETFNPAHLYEEAMHGIASHMNEHLASVLELYKSKTKKEREKFFIQERHKIEIEIIKLLKNINDDNVFKMSLLQTQFAQKLFSQKKNRKKNSNPEIEFWQKIFELAQAREIREGLANEIKVLQQTEQQQKKSALADISTTSEDEIALVSESIPPAQIIQSCKEHEPEVVMIKNELSLQTEVLFSAEAIDQTDKIDENDGQKNVVVCDKNGEQRSKEEKNAERKARILARINFSSTEKVVTDKPIDGTSRDRAKDLVPALPKHLRSLFDELVTTTDLHKRYTFKNLLSLIKGFNGVRVGKKKTGGSHFTFAIPKVGSIYLVYAHAKNKDSIKLSGGYVKTFISQLVSLGFINQN